MNINDITNEKIKEYLEKGYKLIIKNLSGDREEVIFDSIENNYWIKYHEFNEIKTLSFDQFFGERGYLAGIKIWRLEVEIENKEGAKLQ